MEVDDGQTPFTLQTRQPWADKARASAKPTEEQTAWLLAEGVIKEDEPEKEVTLATDTRLLVSVDMMICNVKHNKLGQEQTLPQHCSAPKYHEPGPCNVQGRGHGRAGGPDVGPEVRSGPMHCSGLPRQPQLSWFHHVSSCPAASDIASPGRSK